MLDRLKKLILHNRPSRKPQLWEDIPLVMRRRVELEIGQRTRAGWMDTPRIVDLSRVGNGSGHPPIRMSLVPRDSVARALFLYGTYEICGTRLLQAFLCPGMTFVDVGANIGYYSLLAARAVGPAGAVHAFEPNEAVRPRLEENIRLNNLLDRVYIRPQAVARTSGESAFYRSVVSDNSGLSSILPGSGRTDVAEMVPCVSLDDFVASLPSTRSIDLIKIDVEGAEAEVLAGGQRVLGGDDAPAIMFESRDVAEIEQVLRPHRYAIRRLHYTLARGLELVEPGPSFHGIFDDYEPPNYFATRDEGLLDRLIQRVRARSSAALRVLGRL